MYGAKPGKPGKPGKPRQSSNFGDIDPDSEENDSENEGNDSKKKKDKKDKKGRGDGGGSGGRGRGRGQTTNPSAPAATGLLALWNTAFRTGSLDGGVTERVGPLDPRAGWGALGGLRAAAKAAATAGSLEAAIRDANKARDASCCCTGTCRQCCGDTWPSVGAPPTVRPVADNSTELAQMRHDLQQTRQQLAESERNFAELARAREAGDETAASRLAAEKLANSQREVQRLRDLLQTSATAATTAETHHQDAVREAGELKNRIAELERQLRDAQIQDTAPSAGGTLTREQAIEFGRIAALHGDATFDVVDNGDMIITYTDNAVQTTKRVRANGTTKIATTPAPTAQNNDKQKGGDDDNDESEEESGGGDDVDVPDGNENEPPAISDGDKGSVTDVWVMDSKTTPVNTTMLKVVNKRANVVQTQDSESVYRAATPDDPVVVGYTVFWPGVDSSAPSGEFVTDAKRAKQILDDINADTPGALLDSIASNDELNEIRHKYVQLMEHDSQPYGDGQLTRSGALSKKSYKSLDAGKKARVRAMLTLEGIGAMIDACPPETFQSRVSARAANQSARALCDGSRSRRGAPEPPKLPMQSRVSARALSQLDRL